MLSPRVRFHRLQNSIPSAAFLMLLAVGSLAAMPVEAADPPVDYARDVKHILSNRCYACHGPDESQRKADLRLDVRDSAIAGAIVPGDAGQSELIRRITTADPEEQMPPAGSKKPVLTPAEIDVVTRWINQGAKFDSHWSFAAPHRPEVPKVQDNGWVRNAIDAFILARLEAAQVKPGMKADRRTLARRLSFDLVGLPPKAEDVAAFVADESPEAYERYVDRLLASPQFGERMAVFWLDQVRFADTNGIHGDNHQEHAPFRDYVIDSFNANKPFNRFTIEQLAGDLLPDRGRTELVGSGYNRLNMVTREGGAQAKEYMAKYAADRVRNASSVWLGMTMACCECHDHKFDPLKTKDFYSFAAFFADVQEVAVGNQPVTNVPLPEQEAKVQALDKQLAELQTILNTSTAELEAAQVAWEVEYKKQSTPWIVLQPTEAKSAGGAELKIDADGSILATGANPATDTFTITAKTNAKGITALRLEVLSHKSLPASGPGRASNGNFVLNEVQLLAPDAIGDLAPTELQNASATFEQKDFSIGNVIDGKQDQAAAGWAISDQFGKDQNAVFETKADLGTGDEQMLQVVLHQNHGAQHVIGRFRLAVTTAARPVKAMPTTELPAELTAALAVPADKRDQPQKDKVAAYYRTIAPQLAATRSELGKLQAERQALIDAAPKMLVTTAMAPREMRVLPRGNWLDETGEVVMPGVPGFLPPLNTGDRRANRLDLANWLVAAENPLTARVMVNRLWKILYGKGLVGSLEDFGSQGEVPTHPELLDWLAVEFRESGWDVKHMLKLMALSQAYQQTSQPTDDQLQKDSLNQLVSRQNRFRLEAEFIRDNALAVSGLLSYKMGGESAKPYQPALYWQHLNFPQREYQQDAGENLYRRGVYTYWCRTFLHPSLLAFDAPSREACTVERSRSNTPLQALVLLNDPTYVESARKFAEQIVGQGGDSTESRLKYAMQHALNRDPSAEEMPLLLALWEKHHAQFAADTQAAEALDHVGEAPVPAAVDTAELAAWTSVARVILNLHETITRN